MPAGAVTAGAGNSFIHHSGHAILQQQQQQIQHELRLQSPPTSSSSTSAVIILPVAAASATPEVTSHVEETAVDELDGSLYISPPPAQVSLPTSQAASNTLGDLSVVQSSSGVGGGGGGSGLAVGDSSTLDYIVNDDGSCVCKLCGEVTASRTHWYRHKYKVSEKIEHELKVMLYIFLIQ